MPYQGNTPVESYIATVKDSFNGNGSTTAFTMSKPTQVNDVRVVVENVIQDPSVAYTVSGTTITFTSAPPSGTNNIYVIHLGPAVATAQPPAEIADATTFASNVSVQGSFTSPGIDDNADATALTIDSSEVVLVGKTSNTFSQQGVALRANNDSQITRDGGNPLSLNRTSSDGDIAKFFKDGTTVGSIGVASSRPYFTDGTNTGLQIVDGSTDRIQPCGSSGASRDNAIDLGQGSSRFKDAYLSGGVYLGGIVSANKLDDFETGSFTPTFTSSGTAPSLTYTTQGGTYVKVGNLVTIWIKLRINNISSAGSGNLRVAGLPFTVTDACAETGGSVGLWLSMASATGTEIIQQRSGGQQLFVLQNTTNGAHSVSAMANGGYLRCTTSYTTA
jgi:hypothetical protein